MTLAEAMNRKNSKLEAAMERERKESQVFRFSTCFFSTTFCSCPRSQGQPTRKASQNSWPRICFVWQSLRLQLLFSRTSPETALYIPTDPKKQIFTLEKCDLETFDHYYEKTSPGQWFDMLSTILTLLYCIAKFWQIKTHLFTFYILHWTLGPPKSQIFTIS